MGVLKWLIILLVIVVIAIVVLPTSILHKIGQIFNSFIGLLSNKLQAASNNSTTSNVTNVSTNNTKSFIPPKINITDNKTSHSQSQNISANHNTTIIRIP